MPPIESEQNNTQQPEQIVQPNAGVQSTVTYNPASIIPPESSTGGGNSKKPKLIIAGIIVLIIIGAAASFMLLHKPASKIGNITNSSGSGLSFSFSPSDKPVQYNGVNVVQACNLVPLDSLAKAGYTLNPGAGTDIFYRTYFSGQGGDSKVMMGKLGFNVLGGPYFNTCNYLLAKNVTINAVVVQPSYVQDGAFSNYVATQKPTALPAISGVSIYQYNDPTDGTPDFAFISADKKVGAQLALQAVDRNQDPSVITNVGQAIVKIMANNITAQSKKPTGPGKLAYTAQAFPATIADACNLTNNNDFKQIYGVDQAPLITQLGGGPGVTTLNGHSASFVDNECDIESYVNEDDAILRSTPDFSLPPSVQYLTIRTETYLDTADAQAAYTLALKSSKGGNPASGIGDQVFFATQAGGLDNPLVLRKGRIIVELSPAQTGVPSTQSNQQIISELTPLGKKVAKEL